MNSVALNMKAIDTIIYGNPTIDKMKYLKGSEWTPFINTMLNYPFPKNSSEETRHELETLYRYQEELKAMDKSIAQRFISYDEENPMDLYIKFAKSRGLSIENVIKQIVEDSKYVAVGLKYKYQRARPYQLAHYYKVKLTPYPSCVAITPSYPSGHTFQSLLLSSYLSAKLPNEKETLVKMAKDISNSRLSLGLHYPSDASFGFSVAKKMTETEIFVKKYGKI